MRLKKAMRDSIFAIAEQMITIICGLILPRMILVKLGSAYNGITSSISQFLQSSSLLVAGVAGVTKTALYMPLAYKNRTGVSAIVVATEQYLRRLSLFFVGGLILFASVYPFFLHGDFSWLFCFLLTLIMGADTAMRYFFGLTYQTLLQADQHSYVYLVARIISVLLNTGLATML